MLRWKISAIILPPKEICIIFPNQILDQNVSKWVVRRVAMSLNLITNFPCVINIIFLLSQQ